MMSKRQNSVTVIFRSEYCIDTYFADGWNTINIESAQDAIMVIYDVKYGNYENTKQDTAFYLTNVFVYICIIYIYIYIYNIYIYIYYI